jgi:hypothetical protein
MTEHEIHMIACDQIDAEINAHNANANYTVICWKKNRKTGEYSYDVPIKI